MPEMRTLCIGVDVTWWGGGGTSASRWETIVAAILDNDGPPLIRRVHLGDHPNPHSADLTEPNFDRHGAALCSAIADVFREFPGADDVIVALDSPLHCRPRPDQLPRKRAVRKGAEHGLSTAPV